MRERRIRLAGPSGDDQDGQSARYQAIREAALAFAEVLDANVPDGAAVALNGKL